MSSARDVCRRLARTKEYGLVLEREDPSSVNALVERINWTVVRNLVNTTRLDLSSENLTPQEEEQLKKLPLGVKTTLREFYKGLERNIGIYIPAMSKHYSDTLKNLLRFTYD